ncbi:MAG TPA: phosphoribosylanthranilate isomerase [Bacteroidales bacterium]
MIRVKVCGMTSPDNVTDIAEAKPDYMGFIFYPGSKRYVGGNPENSLFNNVSAGIKRVGVFINEDNHKILNSSINKGLDMIQLHGEESPFSCLQLKSSGMIVVKTFSIGEEFNFEILSKYMPGCDYFLFDTKSETPGGSGKKFNWDRLEGYSLDKPFFLSGGIGPEDSDLIRTLSNKGLFAVDINSRFETAPGIKDPVVVKTFIEEIKNDEQ